MTEHFACPSKVCQLSVARGRLPNIGGNELFCLPLTFKMGKSGASSQDETGSESDDTGFPCQAIPGNIQALSTGLGRQDSPGKVKYWQR